MAMHWQKERVEAFLGGNFTQLDQQIQEMRFEAGAVRYLLWVHEQTESVILRADPHDPGCPFPVIEVECQCTRIEESEAIAVGPVLLFCATSDMSSKNVRIRITRTREGRLSIATHWP